LMQFTSHRDVVLKLDELLQIYSDSGLEGKRMVNCEN